MIYDDGGFLLQYQAAYPADKLFRIHLVHIKLFWLNLTQNPGDGLAGQSGIGGYLAQQVVLHGAYYIRSQVIMLHFFLHHHAARLHVVVFPVPSSALLGLPRSSVSKPPVPFVDGSNGFLYQFLAFEVHCIGVFVVDAIPEFLELLLRKVLIQSVLRSLRCTSVFYHTVKGRRIPNAFYQFVNPFAVWLFTSSGNVASVPDVAAER